MVHHMLLAAAVVAIGHAALRAASLVAPSGLERVLSAAALGVAAAVIEALLLGVVGLGGNSLALGAAAGVTWLAARLLPAPTLAPLAELRAWWSSLPRAQRVAAGAVAGAWLVWQGWILRHPALGFDTVLYHLSEASVWAGNGHPGRADAIFRQLPVTRYPVTDEVLLSWGMGLSRSLVPASILVPPQVVLLGLAGWLGLRELGVPAAVRTLGTAALCASPAVIAWQSNGALPDPASLAWLVSCGALCAASVRRPALVAPALLAAGLAVGTKTPTAPIAVGLLAATLWVHRAGLRRLWRPLAVAALLAVGAGGVWYLRNLVDHGSPLWPFVAAPWGDPLPASLGAADYSFLQGPRETVRVVGDLYLERFLGGIVLLACAVLAPLVAWRRRAVSVAAGVTAVSFVVWAAAPYTGVPPPSARITEGVFSTTRYLMPAVAAAVVTLALAGSGRGHGARLARLALATGFAIELVQAFHLGFPAMPSPRVPLAGALVGAAAVAAALALRARAAPRLGVMARPLLLAAALALGALLALPADGYLRRHAQARIFASGLNGWMARQPDDARAVGTAPIAPGTLAGDRLRHRLEPIPRGESCSALRARNRSGYVVLYTGPPPEADVMRLSHCIPRPPAYRDPTFRAWAPES